MIPDDVDRYIARRFRPAEQADARALLQSATIHDGTTPSARLLRCAAVASGGALERLRYEVSLLRIDYRDVIMDGEYRPAGGLDVVRVRNLEHPIPDDV